MTVTMLDPATALILVDLQKGVLTMAPASVTDPVVHNAAALAAAFRSAGLPVVLVNAAGGAPGRTERARSATQRPDGWTELIPELNAQASDHTVTKRTWGAFTNTDLDEYLRSRAVTQLVIGGIATSIGVGSTARQAHEHGYNVTLAVDAMADMDPDAHDNAITRIFPRLGETGTTEQILELLAATRV